MIRSVTLVVLVLAACLDAASLVVVGTTGLPNNVIVLDKSDPNRRLASFTPYGKTTSGVFVAVGDVNHDGNDDVITGPGTGGLPLVRVFTPNGLLIKEFMAFDGGFAGGVRGEASTFSASFLPASFPASRLSASFFSTRKFFGAWYLMGFWDAGS